MFDFHTHILPGIDDGSRNVQESVAMIEELARQGAAGIAATPHFYAHRSTPEHFFARRQAAWEQLKANLWPDAPRIRLGAEVQYFEGIHRFDDLKRFCIEGTDLLLVEMPTAVWTTRMEDTILELNCHEDITVLLAHIERYLPYRNEKSCEHFLENGIIMQANTDFFVEKPRTAMKMLREGNIHLLGTDTHNMESRRPNLAQALEVIRRKNGDLLLREMTQSEEIVLNESKTLLHR